MSNASALNSQNIRRLRGALVMLEANILSLSHVSKLQAVVLSVVEEVQEFFSGLDDLLSGRLTLSLVSEKVVSSEFMEFRAAAQKQGYDSVFPEPAFFQFFSFQCLLIQEMDQCLFWCQSPSFQ